MKHALLGLSVALGLFVSQAHAVISVNSSIAVGEGLRAQAVIKNPTGLGETFMAVAIKEIRSSVLIRDGNISNGIMIQKRQLTSGEAWGENRPFGYEGPPITDPEGPWRGLIWPYRDQYDYFPDEFDPLGNAVGTFFSDDPGVYGWVNIDGIARGGPTDPEPAGSSTNLLMRGVTGNGLSGPASYFDFNIIPLVGPFDRFVRIQVFAASAIVVQQHMMTGEYSEILVPIPDFVIEVQLPEPAIALPASMLAMLMLRRRRVRI